MAKKVFIEYDKENGICSSVKPLADSLGVTDRTVANYVSEGMPHIIVGKERRFYHRECKSWIAENKDFNKELESIKTQVQIKEIQVRTDIRELDKKVKEGSLISYEDVDEELAKHNTLLINQYKIMLNTFPKKLANKTQLMIKKTLDSTFKKNIDELRNLLE